MKSLLLTAILTIALAACVSAPNTPPSQVTSAGSFGGIKVTASGLPVTSGNPTAIPAGNSGTGQ